jgi:hypothetical protein
MKRINALMIVALLVVVPILLAPRISSAQAPQFTLDHFKCWTVQDAQPANDFVLLMDQFDRLPVPPQPPVAEQVFVGSPALFCNPTVKVLSTGVVTPIRNPDHHLKMYLITTHPTPTRTVTVTNQFGANLPLIVYRPIFLAVPTQKDNHKEPVGLDHFKCYLVQGTPTTAAPPIVVLQDQFDRDKKEQVKILRPVLLCNPTVKVHEDTTTPVANEREHLVCYTFTPSTAKQTRVKTQNQFGEEKFTATYSRLLCVPSLKTDQPS